MQRQPPSLYRLPVQGQPPSLHRLLVQVLKCCQPVMMLLSKTSRFPVEELLMLPVNLRVNQSWIVNRPHQLLPMPRVNCQKIQLTRTSPRNPTTERQSEGSDLSWAGTRFLTSTVPLPPWIITHLLGPESSQPGKCQLN